MSDYRHIKYPQISHPKLYLWNGPHCLTDKIPEFGMDDDEGLEVDPCTITPVPSPTEDRSQEDGQTGLPVEDILSILPGRLTVSGHIESVQNTGTCKVV